MIKVLFVCQYNICRSVVAEYTFNQLINENNLNNKITCKSAGISATENQSADPNISLINLSYHKTHKLKDNEFLNYDYLIALDEIVEKYLNSRKNINPDINIMLLKDYETIDNEANIISPYDYNNNFDKKLELQMFETIKRCCFNLLKEITE